MEAYIILKSKTLEIISLRHRYMKLVKLTYVIIFVGSLLYYILDYCGIKLLMLTFSMIFNSVKISLDVHHLLFTFS